MHGVGAADGLQPRFRQPVISNLPLRCEIFHRPGHILDGHLRIDAMLVEQVDAIGPQTSQLPVDHLPDVFGPAVHATASLARLQIDVEAEFRAEDDPVADALQGFPDDFLRHERTVGLGSVQQSDAEIHCTPDECNSGASIGAARVQIVHHIRAASRMPLNAETDRKDFERTQPPGRRP